MFDPDPNVFSDLSDAGLEELQLAAQNHAANIRKSIVRQLDMWVEQWALASQARWVRETRKASYSKPKRDITAASEGLIPRSGDGR